MGRPAKGLSSEERRLQAGADDSGVSGQPGQAGLGRWHLPAKANQKRASKSSCRERCPMRQPSPHPDPALRDSAPRERSRKCVQR